MDHSSGLVFRRPPAALRRRAVVYFYAAVLIGGKEKNKHASMKLRAGRGTVGKSVVAGVKDRETNQVSVTVVTDTEGSTLRGFVAGRVSEDAMVYTDEHAGYRGLQNHASVKHGVGEYVKELAHTNGIESFWSMLKKGYYGTYHKDEPVAPGSVCWGVHRASQCPQHRHP